MRRRWIRRVTAVAAVFALGLSAVACSSSGDSTASSSDSSSPSASSESGASESSASDSGASESSASNSGSAAPSGDPILIGVPGPTSGQYASAGEDIVNAAKLAASDINDKGGVLGRPIEIIGQDDACQAQTAAQAASKLISQGIVAAAGGYCSGASAPELAAFHDAKIPYVMAASTNPDLTEQGFPEAFRTIFRDDAQGPFVAKFIHEYLKATKVAVVHDSTTYAKGLADATVKGLKDLGIDVVFFDALTPGQSDYTSILTKVAQSKPDVFYYSGYFAEFGLLLKQAKQLGLSFQMMGGDANNDPTIIATAGSAADGVLIDTAPLAQFISTAAGYVGEYKAKYGNEPGPYGTYTYDGVGVIAKAIEKAGSTDPAEITKALHDVGDYEGVTGTFHFNAKGDREPVEYIIITIKDGKFALAVQANKDGVFEKVGG